MHPSASTSHAGKHVLHLSPRDIPPLPDAMVELLGIANDPNVSFDKLSEVMCRDQALTLRVLAVANSPYYGCSRRIDSVRSAIAVLGTKQVQNIASAMALAPAFESRRGPQLWQHGLTVAVWTSRVVHALGVPPLDYVFTAGLLHDIGVVLLLGGAPEQEDACIAAAERDGLQLCEVERERLGTDHAEIGARACSSWKLPGRLAELVRDHHDDDAHGALDLRVLQVASALAELCDEQRDPSPQCAHWSGTMEALARLGLNEEDVDSLIEERGEVCSAASAFG
ncbi:MAG: HDOD domain-containing protein [Nannocystaceae bacterium]|nr:HDOD domain-containing protein [Nannocystaceae bacterium]